MWIKSLLNKNDKIFLLLITLLVFAPILFFGPPEFYGDDVNFHQSIVKHGIGHGILNWVNEYGIAYRPIAIVILYLLYGVFGDSTNLMYFTAAATYVGLIYVLYSVLKAFVHDSSALLFTVLFVATFPLGSTVYVQLSSMVMTMAVILFLIMLKLLFAENKPASVRRVFFCLLLWIIMLLIYEQVVGLVVIIFLLTVIFNLKHDRKFFSVRDFYVCSAFALIALAYVTSYTLAARNPKIVSLHNYNAKVSSSQSKPSELQLSKGQIDKAEESAVAPFVYQGRAHALFLKLEKVSIFFSRNFHYSMNELLAQKGLGKFILFYIFVVGFMFIFLPSPKLSLVQSYLLISIGFSWVLVTLAPFFLYKSIHMPPYVLQIPSIGFGLMLLGLVGFVGNKFSQTSSKYLFKLLLLVMVWTFPIQQYGYFFGLKDEIAHWQMVSKAIIPHKEYLLLGRPIYLEQLTEKPNRHIFWIEDAIGKRYFRSLLGNDFAFIDLNYDAKIQTLKLNPVVILNTSAFIINAKQ